MLAAPGDLKVSGSVPALTPLLLTGVLGVAAMLLGLWWIRERRITEQHRAMRIFHTLCEEIIAAPSPSGIAEKLMTVLPSITQATGAWLYIFNRRTKSLERVPTEADPEPMVVPVEAQPDEELVNGAAVCFQNQKQLNIPDVRRSQYLNTRTKQNSPRSAMIVPLSAQGDVQGVLEAGNANRLGYFSIEEQASIQHLANQVAAALKLQEQRAIREQLFRSEKLAATGQLISGVANELRAPLEVILHLSLQLASALATHDELNRPRTAICACAAGGSSPRLRTRLAPGLLRAARGFRNPRLRRERAAGGPGAVSRTGVESARPAASESHRTRARVCARRTRTDGTGVPEPSRPCRTVGRRRAFENSHRCHQSDPADA